MHCPAPGCTTPVAAEMIKELVPQSYDRYDSFALESALARANAVYDMVDDMVENSVRFTLHCCLITAAAAVAGGGGGSVGALSQRAEM